MTMSNLLLDLVRHKAHANAALLSAIRKHEQAASSAELRSLLHHIIVANRFWLLSAMGQPFDAESEVQVPETLDEVIARYRATHEVEFAWASELREEELEHEIAGPLVPGGKCSVAAAITQVCLHSHGHRAQCATQLRALGGTPPATDFILWVIDRPVPSWPLTEVAPHE
jgi:uncharacterized damage-inducible protein DinB